MSYLNVPMPDVKAVRTVRVSDKEVFPDGQTYLIFGVGEVGKNTTGNYYWDNSARGPQIEAVPKNECALYVDELQRGQNKGGFLNWLYTGSEQDPVHVLGLDDPSLESITARRKTTMKFVVKYPQLSYFIPVMKVQQVREGKNISYNIQNGEMLHLVVSASQFDKILSEAKRFGDEADSDMIGRVIQVDVNRGSPNKSDIYKFNATSKRYAREDQPELYEQFAKERLEIINRIEGQINDMHNGIWGVGKVADQSAKAVWANILEKTGMDLESFIAKYYSGPESRLVDKNGESGLDLDNFSIDDE